MKIAVITASMGGIDKPLPFVDQDIEFTRFYITEQNAFPFHSINSRLAAKYYKMLAHRFVPNYDIYIWFDASVEIKGSNFISTMVAQLQKSDIVISKHPYRETMKQEIDFIYNELKNGNQYLKTRYDINALKKEVECYGDLPGLYSCGLFARKNDFWVNRAFDDWFIKNIQWSYYDQFSFIKVVHDYNLKLNVADWGNFYSNDFYKLHKHTKLI